MSCARRHVLTFPNAPACFQCSMLRIQLPIGDAHNKSVCVSTTTKWNQDCMTTTIGNLSNCRARLGVGSDAYNLYTQLYPLRTTPAPSHRGAGSIWNLVVDPGGHPASISGAAWHTWLRATPVNRGRGRGKGNWVSFDGGASGRRAAISNKQPLPLAEDIDAVLPRATMEPAEGSDETMGSALAGLHLPVEVNFSALATGSVRHKNNARCQGPGMPLHGMSIMKEARSGHVDRLSSVWPSA